MNTNQRLYHIENGPNKHTLFDASKYAFDEGAEITVSFDVVIGYTMPKNDPGCACIMLPAKNWKIIGIEHEDGSGESFNLHGYVNASFFSVDDYREYSFEAYFNTKRRKGTIRFHR